MKEYILSIKNAICFIAISMLVAQYVPDLLVFYFKTMDLKTSNILVVFIEIIIYLIVIIYRKKSKEDKYFFYPITIGFMIINIALIYNLFAYNHHLTYVQ